jgi:hypothetical protein
VCAERSTVFVTEHADTEENKLLEDDTKYFTLTKVRNNNGCVAEARLERKSPAPPPGPNQVQRNAYEQRPEATLSGDAAPH